MPHKYFSKDVLFDDEEEWDKKATRYDVHGRHKTLRQRREELAARKEQVLDSTRGKTQNAIRLLKETEDAGISSAAELQRQGDALRKTNEHLDKLNADLTVSEHHISGIESVFKSLKNRITGKSKKFRRDKKKNPQHSCDPGQPETTSTFQSHLTTRQDTRTDKDKNQMIEEDLEEIAISVSRLKQIGIAMEKEIGKQNQLLDVIQLKVENSDIKINDQINRMDKLI